jgi:hypothetical protein
VNVVVVTPPVDDTDTGSADEPLPSSTIVPAVIVATDVAVVNASDPAGRAAANVEIDDAPITLEHPYKVCVTPTSSIVFDPGTSGIPLLGVTADWPMNNVFGPSFVNRSTFVAEVFAVNTHVGIAFRFTCWSVPGGKLGVGT